MALALVTMLFTSLLVPSFITVNIIIAEWTDVSMSSEGGMPSPSMLDQHCQALSNMNQIILNRKSIAVGNNPSRTSSLPTVDDIISLGSGYTEAGNSAISASIGSFQTETQSWISDQASTSDIHSEGFSASGVRHNMTHIYHGVNLCYINHKKFDWQSIPSAQ